jgi:anthranilate synthase/aminodeoxychorismate synthase-like glutamine amidotransferase
MEFFVPGRQSYPEVTLIDCNDSFTHNLLQAFLKIGAPVRVFRAHETDIDTVISQLGSYLVFSPGPGVPDEAGIAKSLYEKVKGKIPVLGVCLGMQGVNEVLGGITVAAPIPVHGKISMIEHDGKGIFTGIVSPTPVARYHSLMITPSELLEIQSEFEDVIMAYRIPSLQTVAVQFHTESFLTRDGQTMLNNFLEGLI